MRKKSLLTILSISLSVVVQGQTAKKKLLLEEFTTASCGMCPFGSYKVNKWHEEHSDNSIVVVIHEGSGKDSMSTALTNSIFLALQPPSSEGYFAPAIMIDRAAYPWINPNTPYISAFNFGEEAQDTIALRVSNSEASVGVEINGSYNQMTRKIDVIVKTTFVKNVTPGDMRIVLYLVEDSVTGTPGFKQFAYDQHCYDDNRGLWVNEHYPGLGVWDTKDGCWFIMGYPHRHVLRNALLTGAFGTPNIIPKTPVIGTPYSVDASFTVPSKYNEKRLSLVAFVEHYGTKKTEKSVLNAEEVNINSLVANSQNGVGEQTEIFPAINALYPLPASGNVHLAYILNKGENIKIEVVDLLGRSNTLLLAEKNMLTGTHELTFNTSGLAKGIYYLVLSTDESHTAKKLIISGEN